MNDQTKQPAVYDWQTAIGFALVATAAAVGLTWLARGSRLSLAGAALVALGAPMGAASNAVSALVAYRLTDPQLSQNSAVDVFAGTISPIGSLFAGRGGLSWWQAALIGVGVLLGFAADEGPIGALFTLPLCLGMLIAARRLTAPSH